MRSLIIIEVEHGESTDGLSEFAGLCYDVVPEILANNMNISIATIDHTFKVDLPSCFKLDQGE